MDSSIGVRKEKCGVVKWCSGEKFYQLASYQSPTIPSPRSLLASPAAVMQFKAVLSICGGHVKKDTDIEQSHDSHKELLRQNVEKQLKVIEGIIEKLLAGLDITALATKERLRMTAHFMALYQRGIAVDNSLDVNRVVKHESMAIEAVIRRIRTEEEGDDFHIIDAEISSYLEIEDDDQDDELPYGTSLEAMD